MYSLGHVRSVSHRIISLTLLNLRTKKIKCNISNINQHTFYEMFLLPIPISYGPMQSLPSFATHIHATK